MRYSAVQCALSGKRFDWPFGIPVENKFGFCVCLTLLSSFAIKMKWKRELVDLLLLSYGCLVTVNGLWLFLTVPWVGLQCVIMVLPDHTHLFSLSSRKS